MQNRVTGRQAPNPGQGEEADAQQCPAHCQPDLSQGCHGIRVRILQPRLVCKNQVMKRMPKPSVSTMPAPVMSNCGNALSLPASNDPKPGNPRLLAKHARAVSRLSASFLLRAKKLVIGLHQRA